MDDEDPLIMFENSSGEFARVNLSALHACALEEGTHSHIFKKYRQIKRAMSYHDFDPRQDKVLLAMPGRVFKLLMRYIETRDLSLPDDTELVKELRKTAAEFQMWKLHKICQMFMEMMATAEGTGRWSDGFAIYNEAVRQGDEQNRTASQAQCDSPPVVDNQKQLSAEGQPDGSLTAWQKWWEDFKKLFHMLYKAIHHKVSDMCQEVSNAWKRFQSWYRGSGPWTKAIFWTGVSVMAAITVIGIGWCVAPQVMAALGGTLKGLARHLANRSYSIIIWRDGTNVILQTAPPDAAAVAAAGLAPITLG